jgi:REP-associated tyrosine transposase
MPRTARASVAGMWYHVLNSGNRRETVFRKPGDYDAYVKAMADATARSPLDLLGYCLMPATSTW